MIFFIVVYVQNGRQLEDVENVIKRGRMHILVETIHRLGLYDWFVNAVKLSDKRTMLLITCLISHSDVGHAETAHNRIASVVLSFKEALLEEAEKKKEKQK